MIIVKNAFRNMIRNKGRNFLIAIIITIITLCTCIALAIHQAGVNLVQTYKDTNHLSISFSLNMNELRNASDDDKTNFQSLTIDDIENYEDSDLVKDYYYTLESSLSSDMVEAVDDNVRPDMENDENRPEDILEDMEDDDSKLVQNNGLSASFYLTDNDLADEFEEEVRSKGLSDYYTVSTNEEEILASLEPVQNIVSFSVQFLIVILIIGIVVLTIINFLNIRDRKYEIGVLRAIGMSKTKVTSLLILEIFFVALVSLVIGTSTGTLLAQPVTNKILENEITSYTDTQMNTQNNFGGEEFEKPSKEVRGNSNDAPLQGGGKLNARDDRNSSQTVTDYVDSLTVHISPITILELFAISILLIIGSSIVACLFVNKYNPNTILQNRN